MKDFVRKVHSFVTFDYPLQAVNISTQFAITQAKLQNEMPGWTTTATRLKLIAQYWYTYVAGHFALLFGLPAVIIFVFYNNFEQPVNYLFCAFIAGLLSFLILYLFHYRPNFCVIYLPRLETVTQAYERKQIEHLEKCRQTQLSNLALALVFYVFDKAAGINSLQCSDQSALWLTKLYGVDKGSMKKNLELILGKKNNLLPRKQTEIQKCFEETYAFFDEIQFVEGTKILRKLQTKFQPVPV